MNSFVDLQIWQKGMDLVTEVYRITEKFPKSEQFGLTTQLRKSSVSTLANFAEGFSRLTNDDKTHKYVISRGECSETYALLLIAVRLKMISEESSQNALQLSKEVGRMLSGFIQRFRKTS